MRSPALLWCTALLILGFLAGTARAAPLVLLEDRRLVQAFAEACGPQDFDCPWLDYSLVTEEAEPAAPFADWTASVATEGFAASHSSEVSTTSIDGTGSAFTGPTGASLPAGYEATGDGAASSYLLIDFEVVEPTAVRISGVLSVQSEVVPGDTGVAAAVRLNELTSGTSVLSLSIPSLSGDFTQPFDERLVLAPGAHRLSVRASSSYAPASSAFDFHLVVPEPGTGTLLATGMLALARGLRGRRPRSRSRCRSD